MGDFDKRSDSDKRSDFGKVSVSRSDIARLAGVRRPAVTNWERRHGDFPAPVGRGDERAEPETFRADEVLEWLSGRVVPANALRPGEPVGTTYGDRFRAALTGDDAGKLLSAVGQLAGPDVDQVRGRLPLSDYLTLLLSLVFVRATDSERWSAYVKHPEAALADQDVPAEFRWQAMADVLDFLDRNPPGAPEESRLAFDRLLALFRDTVARAGGEFLTPASVTRVMARALASQGPPAATLHDPFCRTGELLSAYLDAVAAQGREAPAQVSGRVPQEQALRLARMNVRLHGARDPWLAAGPEAPASGPADPAEAFDAVITNPPFGGRVPEHALPASYWRYGLTRSTEYDWLQYVVSRLAPGGRAAVLMPAGATFRGGAAGRARSLMVEDGVVECVMALPPQLFAMTAIPTHIWFLRPPRGRGEEVLFVAGGHLGHMASRTLRALSDTDVETLVRAYTSWRGARADGREHSGTPGLSRAVTLAEIAKHDHRLEPAQYVRALSPTSVAAGDTAAAKDRLARLAQEIARLHTQAQAADRLAGERLGRYGL